MNAIKLTEDQQNKLLEMCKKLFPDVKWGFGDFYTTEVGGIYEGLQYLDVTHINHVVPCIKSRFEIKKDSSDLEITNKDKNYAKYGKVVDGFVDNISENQKFFTKNNNIVQQGDSYDEVYVEGIHWFEFCTTHLFKRIFGDKDLGEYTKGPIDTTDYECNIIDIFENHLIDYLYDKFKKL